MKILAVKRAERFSPNSVSKDLAILLAVADKFGAETEVIDEACIPEETTCDVCLSMAREPENLDKLALLEAEGLKVVNRPLSVKACTRSLIEKTMRTLDIPMPPVESNQGYWIKRGDMAAQHKGEVCYCKDRAELASKAKAFEAKGITDYVVSAHVAGDLIKWYAVRGGFFRYYYPSDDGDTKFGDEAVNGMAHHYAFDVEALRQAVEKVAHAIDIVAYGGDAIVRPDGSFCIIDFNDWPSFSRCRAEAAEAIYRIAEI